MLHRYLSVEDQVAEVGLVKTHLNFILSNPYTIHLHSSLEEAVDIMVEQNVSSLLVINNESQFSGILGLKDATYVPGTLDNYKVTDAMVALEDVITVSPTVTKSEALNLMQNQRIGKLPVLNNDGTIYGLITRKTLNREELHLEATKDAKGRLAVGAAVGVTGDYLTRVKYLIRAGVDVLVLDIARIGTNSHDPRAVLHSVGYRRF